jgi:hypothetical protein
MKGKGIFGDLLWDDPADHAELKRKLSAEEYRRLARRVRKFKSIGIAPRLRKYFRSK